MELTKLIIEAIGIFIWPVTIIVILFTFRRQILGMLPDISEAELPGGLKLKLRRLQKEVEESSEISGRSIDLAGPVPRSELVRIGDPLLAVANIRLETEREMIRLARILVGHQEAKKMDIVRLISRLHERQILSKETHDQLLEYTRITNQIVHASRVNADDIVKSLSIGASLSAHIRYLYIIEYLLEDFDGHGLWHFRGITDNIKFHFWSAIAAMLPEFDYSYEAFCEAATKFNKKEESRAIERDRQPRTIDIPTLPEFLEILEFRRSELERILEEGWWASDKRESEWHWPAKWGKISWTGPIIRGRSRNEAEEELFRTNTAIERYRAQMKNP